MLAKFSCFFFYDLLDQEKIHIHQQVIQFGFFNFMESSITWAIFLEMVFLVADMAKFSIGETCIAVVRIFAKLAVFDYVFSLSGGLTSRF